MIMATIWLKDKERSAEQRRPCTTTTTTIITVRGRMYETTGDHHGVMTTATATCHCVCDNDHYHMEGEERLTTTGDMTCQGGGTTTTTRSRKIAMTTSMQDRLQKGVDDERELRRHLNESSDYWLTSDATFHTNPFNSKRFSQPHLNNFDSNCLLEFSRLIILCVLKRGF